MSGDLGPTISQITQGEVTWAQVLGGKQPSHPMPKQPIPHQPLIQTSRVPPTEPTSRPSLLQLSKQTGNSPVPVEEENDWQNGKSRRKGEKRKASPENRVNKKSEIELSNMFDNLPRNDEEIESLEEKEQRRKDDGKKDGRTDVSGIINSGQEYEEEDPQMSHNSGDILQQLDGHIDEMQYDDDESVDTLEIPKKSYGNQEDREENAEDCQSEKTDTEIKEDSIVEEQQNAEKIPQVDGIVDQIINSEMEEKKLDSINEEEEEEEDEQNKNDEEDKSCQIGDWNMEMERVTSETIGENVKGIQKEEEEEKIDASLADKETTDWSMNIEEREKSEKFGELSLVSISKNKKVRCLEIGTVSVIENSRIELRHSHGEKGIVWDKVIMGEQYWKESAKIPGWPLSPGVFWRDESGKVLGLVYCQRLPGEPEKVRDRLFDCIMEVQRGGEEDDVGFGLFD